MLLGLVSTIAFVLAMGPQLQTFQVEDEAPSVAEASEPVAQTEVAVPVQQDETPDEIELDPDQISIEPTPLPENTDTELTPTAEKILKEAAAETTEALPEPASVDPEPIIVQRGDVPQSEWPTILTRASDALAAAKTAKGKFMQSNADGSVVTGTFALNRPGRMRFDYDDPTPVLIVSNGTTVAMADTELETVDRVPIGATPLGLILSTELDVDTDVDVLAILQNGDRIGIRVQDAAGELEGTLTMVFSSEDYALQGWLAVDGNEQTTVVDLLDVETNVRVDPRQFRLDEMEDEDDER
ncbi:MAG: outer-membrane lipoprotein carrier protein LolA [Pseudomonadota bacterium]